MKLIITALLAIFIEAKFISQRHKFYNENFFYSTKFGAPANANVMFSWKAKLLNYAKVEQADDY